MDFYSFMVHAQQVEGSRLRKRNGESKKVKSFEGSSSKRRLDVQDKPKFKKRFSNQVPTNFSKNRNDRGSFLTLKRGEVLINQKRDQLVVSVVRNMWVNVLLGLIGSMVVPKVPIW